MALTNVRSPRLSGSLALSLSVLTTYLMMMGGAPFATAEHDRYRYARLATIKGSHNQLDTAQSSAGEDPKIGTEDSEVRMVETRVTIQALGRRSTGRCSCRPPP